MVKKFLKNYRDIFWRIFLDVKFSKCNFKETMRCQRRNFIYNKVILNHDQ